MATRNEVESMSINEQIAYHSRRATAHIRARKELEAKRSFRAESDIDTDITSRQDDVFGVR